MMKRATKTSHIISYVLMLVALIHTCSDVYAPLQSMMARSFHVDVFFTQLSMALFMCSVAMSQLFYGPYSDCYGRKKTIIIGLSVMLLGSLMTSLASNISLFIIGRMVQGFGVGVAAAMWRCILRDCFQGDQLIRVAGYVTLCFVVCISGAPMLGSLLANVEWRFVFQCLLVINAIALVMTIFGFEETQQHQSERWSLPHIKQTMGLFFGNVTYMGLCCCVLFTFGAFFAWFVAGPIIVTEVLGLPHEVFSFYSLLVCGGMMFCSVQLNQWLVPYLTLDHRVYLGWMLMILGGLLMMLFGHQTLQWVWVMVPLSIVVLGSGLIYPNLFSRIMLPYPNQAGYAGCIYGFLQMVGAGLLSLVVTYLPDDSIMPLAWLFVLSGVGSACMYFISQHYERQAKCHADLK